MATSRGSINEVQRFFRVQTVRFTWDTTSGMKIAFDFQNYVTARAPSLGVDGDPGSVTTETVPGRHSNVLTLDEISITGRGPLTLDEISITGEVPE